MLITVNNVMNLQSRMRLISAEQQKVEPSDIWWNKVSTVVPGVTAKEVLTWLRTDAKIREVQQGNRVYSHIWSLSLEVSPVDLSDSLKLDVNTLKDNEDNGFQIASVWSKQTVIEAQLYPQNAIAAAMLAGEAATSLTYQNVPFFNNGTHQVNEYDTGLGSFANLFTGTPSGAYPGALPIDESVALDVAALNINKACTYIRNIKGANGRLRRLKPKYLGYPTALRDRVLAITSSRFIPSGNAGAIVDREGVPDSAWFKMLEPLEMPELGSVTSGGSDTSWYIFCEEQGSDMSGICYLEREGFTVQYFNESDAQLGRMRELEWHNSGRAAPFYGRPDMLFKAKAS
jgi:phage major head subunit gpT-like protein